MRPLKDLARLLQRGVQRLGGAAARRLTILGATLLAATSVGPHRALDDFVLALIARGQGGPVGLARHELDLFTFTTGDVEGNRRLMDLGLMLPWWTDPHLRISFFRPVSSATHWLDERLWPSSAALMHAHSLLWFAAALTAAAAVYRRLESSAITAGFAFLLYAIDDAHGPVLAWLANRNALIASTFGFVAILAHDGWRRRGSRALAWVGATALLFGLLSGELAIGALGYLAAYALVLERGSFWRRAASLSPYLGIVVAWRLSWSRGGFGARGSGAYLDPLSDPGGFLRALPEKLVVMLHGQFSVPPSDLAFLGPPAHRPVLVALAIVTCAVIGWLLSPIVRRDGTARFWALGMALSLLPLGATFPSDRLLVFVGLGAMGLLARLFEEWIGAAAAGEGATTARSVLVFPLALVHLVEAPLLLPARSAQMEVFGVAHDYAATGIPRDAGVADETVVIVAAPTLLFANYLQAERELQGVPHPAHLYVLSSASSPIEVRRSGPMTLTVTPEHGFLYTPLEQHYRGAATMALGERVELSAMTAIVEARGADGRPASVKFSFGGDKGRYRFVKWDSGRFVPFELPAEGESVTLPEEDFGKILAHAAFRSI